jgi:hypothetical protein
MIRPFRLAVSGAALLAACAAWTPSTAAPLSMPATAFAGLDIAAMRADPVARRHKPVRRASKARKATSSGIRVAPSDLDGDGKPDTVTSKPATRTKPTPSKPTRSPTGGVYVQ